MMVRINSSTIRQILWPNAQKGMSNGRKLEEWRRATLLQNSQNIIAAAGVHSASGHGSSQQHRNQTPTAQAVSVQKQFLPQCTDTSSSQFRGSKRHFSHHPNQHSYMYSNNQSFNSPACVLYGTTSSNPYFYHAAYSRGRGLHQSRQNYPHSGLIPSHANMYMRMPFTRYSSCNVAQPAFKKSRPEEEERYHRYDTEESSSRARGLVRPPRREEREVQRQWEYTEYGRAHRSRTKPGVEFSVLSYNILSQQLLEDNSYLYSHCSEDVLDWENRRTRLMMEIISYKPDVLCLQEVQENHYEDFFLPQLSAQGYEGVFQKRTGDKPDGCAVFVKTGNLKICEFFPIIFNRGDLLDRDNVALIVKLRTERKGKEAELFVATTHLLFNPRRGDIKLAQLSLLFAELDKLAHVDSPSDGSEYSPIILCGDFNTEPHSDIYKFVVRGYIRYEGLICRELSGQNDGDRGRNIYLGKQLLPPHVKITDQCQYVNSLQKRNVQIPENICRIFTGETPPFSETSEGNKHIPANNPDPEANHSRAITPDISDPSVTKSIESGLPLSGSDSDTAYKISHTNCPTVSYNTGCLWHKLNLVSAYKHSIERLWHSTSEVTTQHQRASCTLDYIFYNVRRKQTRTKESRVVTRDIEEDRLRLIARYGLLSAGELSGMGGLPNEYLASDHLGLLTKFLLQYR